MKIKRILYSSAFERALKKLDVKYAELVNERTRIFQDNCFDPRLKTHKCKGMLKSYWSFSITYSHRILFEFQDDGTAAFINVDDHSIYQ
ncbi:MAG: type II toxin-antitoxin system mRNA interferase toxin, RelE/StbE family [Candidatus Uhrbacteria bacterium]|nr:type II toxin-antitoxin system mRNA interferase toxin, RelE/StbE family [Candidatus Uhrbacteria bacterium]